MPLPLLPLCVGSLAVTLAVVPLLLDVSYEGVVVLSPVVVVVATSGDPAGPSVVMSSEDWSVVTSWSVIKSSSHSVVIGGSVG